jgi:RHH-type rel operon transcriptional repressor/antitoxin RelB
MAGATAPKSAMFKMFNMLGIRLEPELEERLDSLAKETGRSKSYYARQAIRQYLEDREDYLKGIAALEAANPPSHSKSWSAGLVWTIARTAARQIKKLNGPAQKFIVRFLGERLKSAENRRKWGKPLHGDKQGLWRTALATTV